MWVVFLVTGSDCRFLAILSLETSGGAKPTQCWTSWPQPSRALQHAHVCVHTAPVFQQDMLLGYTCARLPCWMYGMGSPHHLEVARCSALCLPHLIPLYIQLVLESVLVLTSGKSWCSLLQGGWRSEGWLVAKSGSFVSQEYLHGV